ncbi:MAG: NUDIX hydrolase [Candidatus Thalassarchaeum sp.]|nr:NUDIX hydrolase [Candidatus Thalassarchaeum sp.]
MSDTRRHIHLEHDGKLLLVDLQGNGPAIPQMGRKGEGGFSIRLPTPEEAENMGLTWKVKRTNRFRLGQEMHEVIVATPEISWPGEWAWKDAVISDSEVDPVARESVYRTLHRVVSKVVVTNPSNEVLMAKVTRGFFTGCWTLPGGFVDYGEHPREGAEREALEELGINIQIPDPIGETSDGFGTESDTIVRQEIFTPDGICWLSFTYKCEADIPAGKIVPKDDEIEEAKWFNKEEALSIAVSLFDIEAIQKFL